MADEGSCANPKRYDEEKIIMMNIECFRIQPGEFYQIQNNQTQQLNVLKFLII